LITTAGQVSHPAPDEYPGLASRRPLSTRAEVVQAIAAVCLIVITLFGVKLVHELGVEKDFNIRVDWDEEARIKVSVARGLDDRDSMLMLSKDVGDSGLFMFPIRVAYGKPYVFNVACEQVSDATPEVRVSIAESAGRFVPLKFTDQSRTQSVTITYIDGSWDLTADVPSE
jgi:hypothetical protein